MKLIYAAFLMMLLTLGLSTNAQWMLDPDNPMPVCEAEGIESEITVLTDENDGIYIFWLDSRNTAGTGSSEIYGQHYNSSGYAQWETDGRLIVSHYNRIFDYTIQRFDDGTMIAGWASKSDGYTYSDSLHVRKLDDNGLAVWANDLLIANAGFEPNAILSVGEMQFVKDNFSYCMAFYITYYGGSGGLHMSRFDESGSLLSPPDGVQVAGPGGVGHAGLLPAFDLNNNVYLFYSGGNGAGAPLNCVKLNTSGGAVWGPENVIAGTSGLAYQFDAISDPDGITFVWEGSGNNTDLFTCRFNADGTQDWNGNVVPISDVEGQQTIFDLHKSGNYYFITWSDGRPGVDPGNYDIYAQIFDMEGNMLWTDDGIPVMSLNTYIPHPKMGVTPDNSLVIAHQSTIAGYTAQKVMFDGTLAWDSVGVQVASTTFNPFYEEHQLINSADRMIAVWADAAPSGGTNNIYISPVDTALISSVIKPLAEDVIIYPNPASDFLVLDLQKQFKDASISIYSITGNLVVKNAGANISDSGKTEVSLEKLSEGQYILLLENGTEKLSKQFMIVR